jgi:hypothetical protein
MQRPSAAPRYDEVLQALNECVVACEQLVKHGFSPPQSVLKIERATVVRWSEWSPMLERNPDLADTWLTLCASACRSWVDAYHSHGAEVAQECVRACERCIEVCNHALSQRSQQCF